MLAALLQILGLINELLPVAQVAVTAVEAAAPPGTASTAKLAAATTAVNDTIAAAGAASGAFTQTQAAIASGNSANVGTAIGHAIEVALSVSKTFGLFPKAGVVQNAAPLGQVVQDPSNAPG